MPPSPGCSGRRPVWPPPGPGHRPARRRPGRTGGRRARISRGRFGCSSPSSRRRPSRSLPPVIRPDMARAELVIARVRKNPRRFPGFPNPDRLCDAAGITGAPVSGALHAGSAQPLSLRSGDMPETGDAAPLDRSPSPPRMSRLLRVSPGAAFPPLARRDAAARSRRVVRRRRGRR
jgi:hypothetical protein